MSFNGFSGLACRICSGIFPKIRSFELINCIKFDVEQKPHTLNMCVLLLRQKCMQFIIGIKITLHLSHADCDTLGQIYPLRSYKNILLFNGNTHVWREWFQHWISKFCDRFALIMWISSNSNVLYISKIFLFRYFPNDKHDKWSVSLNFISIVILCFPLPLFWFTLPYLPLHTSSPASKYETMNQWWGNAGPALQTLDQRHAIIGSTSIVSWASPAVCKQWICILVYRGAPPLKYQKEEENKKGLITNHQIIG